MAAFALPSPSHGENSGVHIGSQNLIVVADAVIDNREQLAEKLEISLNDLDGYSNASLIAASYQKWKRDCVHHLYGDFSFACIEPKNNTVFLARDHIGTRPLFWSRQRDSLLFGSSIESLVQFSDFKWRIDEKMVAEYLAFPFLPVGKSFFENVEAVPAGGFLLLTNGRAKSVRWWNPSIAFQEKAHSESEHISKCRALVRRAIEIRLAEVGGTGSHFSGGLDSSGVTAMAALELQSMHRSLAGSYAWSPPVSDDHPKEHPLDERARILAIAKTQNIPIRFGYANGENFLEYIDRPIEFEGEADLADEIPVLSAARDDGISVMLSGWGGDEVFSAHGHGMLGYSLLTGRWSLAKSLAREQYTSLKNFKTLCSLFWRELVHPLLPQGLYHRLSPKKIDNSRYVFASPMLLRKYKVSSRTRQRFIKFGLSPRGNLKKHFMAGHLTMRMESWAAWSAPFGFRYRYPLTDRTLIEYLLTLPPTTLMSGNRPRGLARRVFENIVPETASKHDYANEKLRGAARYSAWCEIAKRTESSEYSENCPWIDRQSFIKSARTPKFQDSPAHMIEGASVFAAARIWALYRRSQRNGWLD